MALKNVECDFPRGKGGGGEVIPQNIFAFGFFDSYVEISHVAKEFAAFLNGIVCPTLKAGLLTCLKTIAFNMH
jgi:hypothetical protein